MLARAIGATLAALVSAALTGSAIAADTAATWKRASATIPFPASATLAALPSARASAQRPASSTPSSATRRAPNDPASDLPTRVRGLTAPFQANTGDFDARVAFVAQTFSGTTFVTRDGRLVHSLPGPALATKVGASNRAMGATSPGRGWALTETLVGAHALPRGGAPSETHVSRFIGSDPSRWRSDVPTFGSVLLGEAWPGIRVEVVARGRSVEKVFTVAPGADVRRIAVRVGGAKHIAIAPDGALVAHTGNGPVAFSAPLAWQDIQGQRRPVQVAYALEGHRYRFALGRYDRAHPLVIDPLLQATYLGGAADEVADAMALDAYGNVYVAGQTRSTDFPGTAGGAQGVPPDGQPSQLDRVAFVARLSGDLTRLMQSTYLGGGWNDLILALAVDAQGSVFVAGSVAWGKFPGTASGAQPDPGGGGDAFVAKLSSDLAVLQAATYVGGLGDDVATAMSLDRFGNVYIAGTTYSQNFPHAAGGAQATRNGFPDAFVARLDNALTTLVQSTYLGGGSENRAVALGLDTDGNAFVAGVTVSLDFPGVSGGAQPAIVLGGADGFVARLNPGLTTLTQATYLGGIGYDTPYALAVDAAGNVFVAGMTGSDDFPGTRGGAQPAYSGGVYDGFIAKLNNGLTTLLQASYLGATGYDSAYAVALDGSGNVYVGGTASAGFPGVTGGIQVTAGRSFVVKIDNGLTTPLQATYFGASSILSMAWQSGGALYVAGSTGTENLPEALGGAQAQRGGPGTYTSDAFVARLTSSLRLLDPPSPTAPVIEYYHPGLDHYFVTSNPAEIAGLDAHVYPPVFGGNWERTGQSFVAYPGLGPRTAPVCRFFSAFGVKSSHFYTANPLECAGLTARFPNWRFENLAFQLPLPDAAGDCPAGTTQIYRMYNNGQGGAPNHRLTTDLAIRNDFVANRGWVSEGAGPTGVAMCSPNPSTAGTAEGLWIGATVTQSLVEAFVLDDGTYYLVYSIPNTYNIGGVIQGHGTSIDGDFETADAKDFRIGAGVAGNAALSANYVPGSSLEGTLSYGYGNTTFAATYQAVYEQPASLAAASGTYDGLVGSSAGIQPVTLTAQANGAISGSVSGCAFNGTATPRGNVNLFNLSITFGGGTCLFGTSTLVGFAYYDASTGQLLAFAPNASRTDSILFVGSRP